MLAIEFVGVREDARVFIAELEVTLHAAGRMLGALSIVAVGQRHDQARSLQPLDLPRRDELIDDALRIVREVTKLRLPHDKSVG